MKEKVLDGYLDRAIAPPSDERAGTRGMAPAGRAAVFADFTLWTAGYLQSRPASPIGRLYYFQGGQWVGTCSATVISAGYVLTAAHCVKTYEGFTFYPSQFGDLSTSSPWFSTEAYYATAYDSVSNAADYAIIVFRPASNGERWIGNVTGSYPTYYNSPGGAKLSIGYPGEGNFSTYCTGVNCYPYQCYSPVGGYERYADDASVSYGGWFAVGYGCYMTGGGSGGPVFEQIGGTWYVVSVNSYLSNAAGTYGVAEGCTRPSGICFTYARNVYGPYLNEGYNTFFSAISALG